MIISDGGFCEVDLTSNNVFGSNQWPEARAGDTVQQPCSFSGPNDNHNATRKCISREEWNDPVYSQCIDIAYENFNTVSRMQACIGIP